MSGPYGGNYSNGGFDLVTPLRKMFGKMDDHRSGMMKVNREHELATQRIAMAHQNSLEQILLQHGLASQEGALQREHSSSEADKHREFEGQQNLENRSLEHRRLDVQASEGEASRANALEIARMNSPAEVARQQRRTMTHGLKIGIRAQGGEGTMAPGSTISVHGFTVNSPRQESPESQESASPKKPTAAKKPTGQKPKKPTTPRRPQPSA